jgi:hypothetical protein
MLVSALAIAASSAAATTPASAFTTIRACLTKAGATHVKHGPTNRATFPGPYRRVTWSYVTSSAGVVGVIWTASGVTHRELAATRACFAPFS